VTLFLDSSVVLAACGSAAGASREVFRRAPSSNWALLATPYVIEEVLCNLPDLPPSASRDWANLQPQLTLADDVLTLDRPTIFEASKDRPILFSALAWADVLLTLGRMHFGDWMGKTFYGLPILRPGAFLEAERDSGRLH
jgi:hypothetical protein